MELTMHLDDQELTALAKQIAPLIAADLAPSDERVSPWMTVRAVAAYTGMTEQAVRDAERNGRLHGYRSPTGRLHFLKGEVDAWLKGDAR